jgi:hypothetical protein
MASIVAYIEIREDAITRASLFVLAEARRLADDLGATVYALLALGPTAPEGLDAMAGQVGSAGADRILCCADDALAGPSLDASHGPLLATVAGRLKPNLVLFPTGETGAELGRPLAVRMGAAFLPCASLSILPATEANPAQPVVSCWRAAGDGQRLVNLRESEHPVVATLRAGLARAALGEPATDMEMLSYPEPPRPLPRFLSTETDPTAEVAVAERLLLIEENVSGDTRNALAAVLPPTVPALTPEDPRRKALASACPAGLLLVAPAAYKAGSAWPGIAPDTLVALLAPRGVERELAMVKLCARPEKDAPLGGLIGALQKAKNRGKTS